MHAIYRQNFGFTDISIGRKHADAPYDDGKDIWDGLAAQRQIRRLKGDLKSSPSRSARSVYEELGRIGLVDDCAPRLQTGFDQRPRLREKLRPVVARSSHYATGNRSDLIEKNARELTAPRTPSTITKGRMQSYFGRRLS